MDFAGFADTTSSFLANCFRDRTVISVFLTRGVGSADMKPKERRETGQRDMFRSRLDQIIDMSHPLVALATRIDWTFLERFGAVYQDKPGRPPRPTRLMAGIAILKHMHDFSDEALCDRWIENPYFQYFCGEEFFQHRLPFDRSSMTRWRQRMGEEKLVALIQESLAIATRTGAAKPSDFTKLTVDRTVQPKNVMFPTDAKLMQRARERLVRFAKANGVMLRQSYARVGKYTRTKPVAKPKLGPLLPVIDAMLEADRLAPVKQRHTAKRIFERLRDEHGFGGGHTVVKDYVRLCRTRGRETFVPLAHPPGHAQVDFGEAVGVIRSTVRQPLRALRDSDGAARRWQVDRSQSHLGRALVLA